MRPTYHTPLPPPLSLSRVSGKRGHRAAAVAKGGGLGAELRVGEADEAHAVAGGVPARRELAVAASELPSACAELVEVPLFPRGLLVGDLPAEAPLVGVGLPLRRLVGGWVVLTRWRAGAVERGRDDEGLRWWGQEVHEGHNGN